MELKPQIIKKDDKNEYVVLPYDDYLKMCEALQDYEDLMDLRKAKFENVNEPLMSYKDVEEKLKKKK